MPMLRDGQEVQTVTSGLVCKVEVFIGGGGQGEVYRARLDGQVVALKWYFPAQATPEQRSALEVLARKGPPTAKFLWPMELTEAAGVAGFGYVMPLREARYKSIVDLMKRRAEPTFRALATAGLELAHSFLDLHAMGLCYRDISFGNVFFDPDSGEVLICDNDNVVVNGASIGGVAGTPRFMAPEIVCGSGLPDTQTDLFSLSVLLFYILMLHHPLEGRRELTIKCFDLPAMTKLYGTDPLFIFDPCDRSNEPVPGYHDNAIAFWPIYPEFLRALFTRAFTDGIRDPQNGRQFPDLVPCGCVQVPVDLVPVAGVRFAMVAGQTGDHPALFLAESAQRDSQDEVARAFVMRFGTHRPPQVVQQGRRNQQAFIGRAQAVQFACRGKQAHRQPGHLHAVARIVIVGLCVLRRGQQARVLGEIQMLHRGDPSTDRFVRLAGPSPGAQADRICAPPRDPGGGSAPAARTCGPARWHG